MDPFTLVLIGLGIAAYQKSKKGSVAVQNAPSATPAKKTTHQERMARWGGFAGYVQHLDDVYRSHIGDLASLTSADIDSAIRYAAQTAGVPYQLLYSILAGECKKDTAGLVRTTCGVFAGSVSSAIKANSTAFGIGQVVGKTFDDITKYVAFDHDDLWRPDYGALAAALVLKKKLQSAGGDNRKAIELYKGASGPAAETVAWAEKNFGPVETLAGLRGNDGAGVGIGGGIIALVSIATLIKVAFDNSKKE